ncbi:MAG: NADH-quinone oxidoreductase subunit N, partial [Firmicutes bacterium]|nr:NADH-quinone oxidoreductase subunit N [Bacillota bacterium]
MVLGIANSLISVFLGLEVLSLPLYVLAASERTDQGGEAGIKYLLLGAFASGFLLFGFALIFGATGTLIIPQIAATGVDSPLLLAGFALALVGLLFKLGIVPFHMWVPDVYQGAPTSVTAFMAIGTKVGAAAALLRFVDFGFYLLPSWWVPVLGYLAVLTILVGNVLALVQTDFKRLLAYSGIGNAGFLLVGLAAHNIDGARAVVFYLWPYGLGVVGALSVLLLMAPKKEGVQVTDFRGLWQMRPGVAGVLAVSMLSLAGIPLTGGFTGKFYLLLAAMDAHQSGIAIGLVVGAMIGLAAYIRPLVYAFSPESPDTVDHGYGSWAVWTVAGLTLFGTVGLGVYPAPLVHMVNQATNFFWLH